MEKMEKRVIRDENGFYRAQIRFLPEEDWRTFYITESEKDAKAKIGQ